MSAALAKFVEEHGRALVIVVLSFAIAGYCPAIPDSDRDSAPNRFPRIVILADSGVQPVDVQMLTVTRPLEETIRLVPGITDVRSVTSRGGTEINAFFDWRTDINNALNLVQGAHLADLKYTSAEHAVLYQPADFLSIPVTRLQFHFAPKKSVGTVRSCVLSDRSPFVSVAGRGTGACHRRASTRGARAGAAGQAQRLQSSAQ